MRYVNDDALDAYPSKVPTDQHLRAEHLSAGGSSHRKERTSSSSRGAPVTPSLASEYRGYGSVGGSSHAVDMLVQLKGPMPAEEYGSTCSSSSQGLVGSGSAHSLSSLAPRSGSGSATGGSRAAAAAAMSARQLLASGETAGQPPAAAAAGPRAATAARQGGAGGVGYMGTSVVPVRRLEGAAPAPPEVAQPLFDEQHQSAAAVAIAAAVAAAAARPTLVVPRRRISSSSEEEEEEEDSSSAANTTASMPLHVQMAQWEPTPEQVNHKKGKTKSRMAALLSSCECRAVRDTLTEVYAHSRWAVHSRGLLTACCCADHVWPTHCRLAAPCTFYGLSHH
jgi:hypothetical protein